MTDDEFELERARIEAIGDPANLKREIKAFKIRRQMDSAKHGALIGYAVASAIEHGWAPTGKAAFAAYCDREWGYSVSQINQYRRLAKDWAKTQQAQEMLLAHRESFDADVKLPEVGTTALADKALKFAEAYAKATENGLNEDEAAATAELCLKPTPRASTDNPIAKRYKMLLAFFAVVVSERPELEQDVLTPLIGAIDLSTMDAIDKSLKSGIIGEPLCAFHAEQHDRLVSELEPPWWGGEPPPQRKPETGPRDDPESITELAEVTEGRDTALRLLQKANATITFLQALLPGEPTPYDEPGPEPSDPEPERGLR